MQAARKISQQLPTALHLKRILALIKANRNADPKMPFPLGGA
jgi:hypothetical protein